MDIMSARRHFGGFCDEYSDFALPQWNDLPDIELYMDQVTALINKHLGRIKRAENKETLTAAMINNYVKLGFLPPPVKKKYSREHIAQLLVICTMKPVMSIPDTSDIISSLLRFMTVRELFETFREMYDGIFLATLTGGKLPDADAFSDLGEPTAFFAVTALYSACVSSVQLFLAKNAVLMLREEQKDEKLRAEQAKKYAAAAEKAAKKAKKEAEKATDTSDKIAAE